MSQLALQLIQQEKAAPTGYLDIGNCGLTPDNSQLQDVWDALSELTHLDTLIFSGEWLDFKQRWTESENKGEKNLLDKIPIVIADLVYLKNLVIAGDEGYYGEKWKISKIENLPPNISMLNISCNQISKIENLPPSISMLRIRHNQISEIENLPPNIIKFDISFNQINDLRPLIPWIESGLESNYSENPLTKNAEYLIAKEKFEKTGYLELGRCYLTPDNPQLQDVWDALSELTHLETLILSNTWLSWMDMFSQNGGRRNLLDKIPTVIAKLVNLKKMIIAADWNGGEKWHITKLENLPPNIKTLIIYGSRISKLENLPPNIETLQIDDNQITKIENLPQSLKNLSITGNQIKDLQPLLPLMKKGIDWEARNNPIENPPMKIVEKGKEAIIRYLEENEYKDYDT